MGRFIFHGVDPERLVLYLGVATAAVILFYLLRTARKRVLVTAGPIWERVISRRRISVRELLSFLAQVLALAALFAALSDPRDPERSLRRRAIAFVVDASASMTAREGPERDRLTMAKEAAIDCALALPPEVPAVLVRAAAEPVVATAWGDSRSDLIRAIEGLEADHRPADLPAAVELASGALRAAAPALTDERVLVVLSDGPVEGPLPHGLQIRVHELLVGRATENVAVVDFDVRGSRGLMKGFDVFLRARNFGASVARLKLAVYTPEVLLGEVPLMLRPGAEASRTYHLEASDAAKVGERITAAVTEVRAGGAGDALLADDRAYAVLPRLRELPVLLVSEGNRFLEGALALNPEVRLTKVKPAAFRGRVPPTTLAIFDKTTPRREDLPANAVFIDPEPRGSPFKVRRRVVAPKLIDYAGGHPVLKGAMVKDLSIAESSVFITDRADVKLLSAEGGALAAIREYEDSRIVAFGFDLLRSDLPMRVAFPVMIRNLVLYFGRFAAAEAGGPLGEFHRVGEALLLKRGMALDPRSIEVKDPEGRAIAAVGYGDGLYLVPPRAGFYTVKDAGGVRPIAVNLGGFEESAIAPPREAKAPARAEAATWIEAGKAPAALKGIFAPERNPPPILYWVYLLLGAALITTLDWILYFLRVIY